MASQVSNQSLRGHLMSWIVVPLIGGIIITLTYDADQLFVGNYKEFIENTLISFAFWSVLANGNGLIIEQIDKYWSWLEAPIKRVIVGTLAMLVFTVIASTIIIFIYLEFFLDINFIDAVTHQGWKSMLMVPVVVTIVVSLWQHGRGFLLSWRQAAIDVEKLKNENLKSRFESLRNQVNPHFLFNSLNALSNLVYDNQDRAVEFIAKLSEVYRYVLAHQNDEVVPLDEEIKFIESFIYLNKIRFGDNLKVEYGLQSTAPYHIPPVTLQMLIENCLKHNEVSKQHPLTIEVLQDDRSLTVRNNKNPMNQPAEGSNGLGLNNIKSRYAMMTSESVLIKDDSSTFEVTIPLLNIK